MPNWIKITLELSGNQNRINRLFKKIKTKEINGEINFIDFNKIIKMPESLKITSGINVDLAIDILNYESTGNDENLKERLKYQWVVKEGITTVDEFLNHISIKKTLKDSDFNEAKKAISNFKKYGHKDWYTWSIDNWGTKWNSSDSYIEGNNLHFQTAWSVPEPLLIKLSEIFSDIQMKVKFADEDIGSNCGEFELLNGVIKNFREYDAIEACQMWDYDPADLFPEIVRERRIDEIFGEEE